MNAPPPKPGRLTVAEFLDWSRAQDVGRHELLEGEIAAMAPERAGHARAKLLLCDRLRAAVADAHLPCETFIDGIGVAVDDLTVLIPDLLLRCGNPSPDDAMTVTDPVVIVEVLSHSPARSI